MPSQEWVTDAPQLRKGDTVFLARITHDDTPRNGYGVYTEASYTPFRTNQSHEEREQGWCGNSNGIDVYALGRAIVVSVGEERRDSQDIQGNDIPPYLSIKVRMARPMDDDAPDMFELVADRQFPGVSDNIVRIFSDKMILAHPEEYPAHVLAGAVSALDQSSKV